MNLFENPFYILGATTKSTKQDIVTLAENKTLEISAEVCSEARMVLTNPRKRLRAEMQWFTGLKTDQIQSLVSMITRNKSDLIYWFLSENDKKANNEIFTGFSLLDKANLASFALDNLDVSLPIALDGAETIIQILASSFEDLNATTIMNDINDCRAESDFPKVNDINLIEEEINNLKNIYNATIKKIIDSFKSNNMITLITDIVENSTSHGTKNSPILIDDVVDNYILGTQKFLTKEESNIKTVSTKIMEAAKNSLPDSTLESMCAMLSKVLKNWDKIAQPIQVSYLSRGMTHEASERTYHVVRRLIVELYKTYNKTDLASKLTDLANEVFIEVISLNEQIKSDKNFFAKFKDPITTYKMPDKQSAQWVKDVTFVYRQFNLTLLSMNPEGIRHIDAFYPLQKINKLGWGEHVYVDSNIGSTVKVFMVKWGIGDVIDEFRWKEYEQYKKFVNCLWTGIGIPLIINMLQSLQQDKGLYIGSDDIIIFDEGIKFLATETHPVAFFKWKDIQTVSDKNKLTIFSSDRRYKAYMYYLVPKKAVLLKNMLDKLYTNNVTHLSDLIGR